MASEEIKGWTIEGVPVVFDSFRLASQANFPRLTKVERYLEWSSEEDESQSRLDKVVDSQVD